MKIGDIVTIDGYSGFCYRSKESVKDIITKSDENTGIPYDVIVLDGGQKFDSRTGFAITPPTAYHIEELLKS